MSSLRTRNLISYFCLFSTLSISNYAIASAFQLWEQDGASIANYHAGYAALANDASIAFYNPAGITRIKNQQLVFGAVNVLSNFKYRGTIKINTINAGLTPFTVTSQGGNYSFVPSLHYIAPLTENLGFGFSITVPFGLKTNYGINSMLRYAATKTSVMVIDFSPSLGWQITEKISLGAGIDLQRMYAEFNSVGGLGTNNSLDTLALNEADGTGYGYHLGGLYQFNSKTRAGLSYHSQVAHHLTGTSKFRGPLADLFNGNSYSSHVKANTFLPAYTALSLYHHFHPSFAMMGTIIYTQWNSFKNLSLNNVSGIEHFDMSTHIQVIIPQHYHNTWNAVLGTDYYASEDLTLRGGIGYDQTPVNNKYRNIQLPDNNRYVFAMGGHYQATKTIGVDLGWTHLFIRQARVNPPPQKTGDQITTTNGNVTGGADVFGAQLTWDLT